MPNVQNDQPWERLEHEDAKWHARFLLFRDLGPNRSINATFQLECAKLGKTAKKLQISTYWYEKAKQFDWQKRAEAWDEYRRKEVFITGYANELKRIERLDKMISVIEMRIVQGFKNASEPKGPSYELIKLYLEALDGIAKETGGRVQKKEVTGASGGPLEVLLFLPEQEQDELIDDEGDSQEWQ